MKTHKTLISLNPSTNEPIWEGVQSNSNDIDLAIKNAKSFQPHWETVSLEEKKAIINQFSELVKNNIEEAAKIISEENGKPFWEAKMEVNSLINKVQVVFDAYEERAKSKTKEMANGRVSITRYRPHGVMAVLGPYNFPMSMPNSHIMPAIYAGNTVVFKPSEKTPKSAEYYRNLWIKAGLPNDVLQIIHGNHIVGEELIDSPEIDGVLFVGSHKAGKDIEKRLISKNKICALEMGGNSPLIIWDYSDIRAAINIAIQSAYISTGQRCSAARRLIVNDSIFNEFVSSLSDAIKKIVVGKPFDTTPTPFMGPMIDSIATERFLSDYQELVTRGANILVPAERIQSLGENFVRPALLDVSNIKKEDKEIFGPLLQVENAKSIKEAVNIANSTKYGLAAGIVTEDDSIFKFFFDNIKAGIINRNQSLTGSTTIAPFGGIKGSGNFRPAGYLSVDYCVYACASIESDEPKAPTALSPGLDF